MYTTADAGVIDAVAKIAANRGVSRAQIALAWVSKHPAVTAPIVGATKPHHLDDAIASADIDAHARRDLRARVALHAPTRTGLRLTYV